MATKFKVKTTCSACGGTGIQPLHPTGGQACVQCGGSGDVETGWFKLSDIQDALESIADKCTDILDKCNDIFEKVSE